MDGLYGRSEDAAKNVAEPEGAMWGHFGPKKARFARARSRELKMKNEEKRANCETVNL
jgi:hypothetical protein